jgi:bacterial/archaeal transporter family-2 protein
VNALTFAIAMPAVALLGVVGSFSSALNGLVGKRLGTFRATLVFLGVGALWCLPIILLFERSGLPAVWQGLAWYLYLPGLINIFLIANLIFVVNRIGTMLMTSAMFCGQVVVSIALDHIGFLGLPTIPATPLRWLSAAVLVAGILIAAVPTRRSVAAPAARAGPDLRNLALLMAFVQGATLAAVSGINAVLGLETGTFTSTFFFLAPGAAFLLVWFLVFRTPLRFAEVQASYLFPGSLNVVGIAGAVLLVPFVGLQFTTAARVTASVLAGLHIDRHGLFGLPQQAVSSRRVIGTIVLSLGVLLTVFG